MKTSLVIWLHLSFQVQNKYDIFILLYMRNSSIYSSMWKERIAEWESRSNIFWYGNSV